MEEDIRQIEIEKLKSRISKLEKELEEKESIILDAQKILSLVPIQKVSNYFIDEVISANLDNLDVIKKDKVINKELSKIDNITFEDNKIIYNTFELATLSDDNFKYFLQNILPVIKHMLEYYELSFNFLNIVKDIKKYRPMLGYKLKNHNITNKIGENINL
jgi:hypothetical protein